MEAIQTLTKEMTTLSQEVMDRNHLMRVGLVAVAVGALALVGIFVSLVVFLPSAERAANENTRLLRNHICAVAQRDNRSPMPTDIVCPVSTP